MNEENSTESIEKYNRLLFNVNNFMVEQTEIADYNQLVKTVVDQLDKLLKPIAIVTITAVGRGRGCRELCL